VPREDEGDDDRAFAEGFESTDRMFARMPSLSVSGKSVLDYGCGLGATSFWLAEHGARRAVGIDIQSVAAAAARREAAPQEVREKISFRQVDGYEVDDERFDLVVSKDTFEHVDDPERYVATMKEYLNPGGELAIGFGPLWKSPWGGHIDFMTRMPWAHLIFPEDVILEERRRFRPDEDPSRFEEIRGGLNRMTLARFLDVMARSGLERRYLATNQATGAQSGARRAIIAALRGASTIPPLREYCTLNAYGVWAKPG
jgi:SAM-dependent methyltransferase